MASTTNYSWSTPDDTALVKDGAAAIRTLGSSVDTTVKALNPGTTAGDIDYYTSSTAKSRIGIGTSGQVLTVNGSGLPSWATASSGGMTLITETNASAATSISFTSIAGTYKHLLVVWSSVYQSASSTSAYWGVRLNNDSTSKYTYQGVVLSNDTLLASHQPITTRFGDGNDAAPIPTTTNISGDYDLQASGKMMIFDYAGNDKKVVQWQSMGGLASSGAAYGPVHETGVYNSTSAITQIDFVRNSTQTCTGNFKLYGVS